MFHLQPGARMVLLVVSLAMLIPLGGSAQECCDARKQYYLSSRLSNGAEAKAACERGFHMASLWEIHDPSNLKHATNVPSVKTNDMGSGPPAGTWGWVRTGWATTQGSLEGSSVPGQAHCFLWTRNSDDYKGTRVRLANDWRKDNFRMSRISPWDADAKDCDTRQYVWCVQD